LLQKVTVNKNETCFKVNVAHERSQATSTQQTENTEQTRKEAQ